MSFEIASFSVNSAQGSAEIQLLGGSGVKALKAPVVLVRFPFAPSRDATQAENDAAAKVIARQVLMDAAAAL